MDKCVWRKALQFDFIQLYENDECLWLESSPYYYNRAVKKKAYANLVNLVQNDFPNADEEFVKKKIKNMRCAFRKAYKKQQMSQRIQDNPTYQPKLWYFDLLMFTVRRNNPETSPPPED